MQIGVRLTDPNGLVSDAQKMYELQEKVASCMTRMFRKPENGGNPFLFSLAAPKPHELRDTLPNGQKLSTAATDGKKYYWNPDFLFKLSRDECPVVMQHESYHIIFFHSKRMRAAEPRKCNIAMDYVVNSCIESDHAKTQRKGKLWGGNIGDPWHLKDLLAFIDGQGNIPKGDCCYADVSQYGRPPEQIYDEIMRHWENSPRKCPECAALTIDPKTGKPNPPGPCKNRPNCDHKGMCCPHCGSPIDPSSGQGYGDGLPAPMDSHMDAAVSKQEVQSDVMRAAEQAVQMRGTVPSEIEDYLGELIKPTLKFTDLVRSACMKKVQDAGMQNDYKRYRKRWITPARGRMRQYLPKRHTHKPRWLAMLDTSGSMGDDDLVYGVSQLKCLGNTEGYVVPVDASPDWNAVTRIDSMEDLKRTKVVGRGGTVFDDFFREFPKRLGSDFDCVIVLTDGYCGEIPKELAPRCDVVWVLTQYHADYKPTFGRVAPLRPQKM